MNLKLPQPEFREGGPSKNGNMKKELPAVRKCLQQVDPTSIIHIYIGKYNHFYSQSCKINIILCRLMAGQMNCSKLWIVFNILLIFR